MELQEKLDILSILKGAVRCKSCVINAMKYIERTMGFDDQKLRHRLIMRVIAQSVKDLSAEPSSLGTKETFQEICCIVAQRLEKLDIRQEIPIENFECATHQKQRHGTFPERLVYISTPSAPIPPDYSGFDLGWQMFPMCL